MRKTLLASLGAAALLSGLMFGNPAKAMTFAAPSAIGAAAANTGLIQSVRYYGYHRSYWGYHRRYWGYYRPHYYGYYRPYYGLYGYYQPYGYYRPYGWYRRYW